MTKYIVFTAEVNPIKIAELRNAIVDAVNTGLSEIYLAISSGGGNISEGIGIAALLKSLSINVITHNIGQTDSVANVIFAAGKQRYSNESSSFMFHGVSMTLGQNNYSSSLLHELYEQSLRFKNTIDDFFCSYTGIPLVDASSWTAKDGGSVFNAVEAKSKGIIHEIRELNIPAGIRVTVIGNEAVK